MNMQEFVQWWLLLNRPNEALINGEVAKAIRTYDLGAREVGKALAKRYQGCSMSSEIKVGE